MAGGGSRQQLSHAAGAGHSSCKFPTHPRPVSKAQGANESVWPRQLSPEAQRREPKPEGRPSHRPCRPVASQSPWHLTCGSLGAPRAWAVGQERRADCREHPGVGGIHAPWALRTLNSSASRPSSPVTPASSFLLSPHLISRSERGGAGVGGGQGHLTSSGCGGAGRKPKSPLALLQSAGLYLQAG